MTIFSRTKGTSSRYQQPEQDDAAGYRRYPYGGPYVKISLEC